MKQKIATHPIYYFSQVDEKIQKIWHQSSWL